MSDEKHWLVWRDKDGLRKIEVFEADEQDEAVRKYADAEQGAGQRNGIPKLYGRAPYDVCLFGSDSLATLCRTHSSWFAPETLDLHAPCDQITTRNPPNPSATVEA